MNEWSQECPLPLDTNDSKAFKRSEEAIQQSIRPTSFGKKRGFRPTTKEAKNEIKTGYRAGLGSQFHFEASIAHP